MIDALIAYFHYLGMMSLLAALVTEHALIGGELDSRRARQLVFTDRVHWISIAVMLVSGLLRTTWFGKGIAFYTGSPLFHAKMTLFAAVVLLAVYPTLKFLDLRRSIQDGMAPRLPAGVIGRVTLLLRMELIVVIVLPLLAVIMARGFGY